MSHSKQQKTGLLSICKSVIASAFGVQSSKNHQHDFQQPSVVPYLFIGVVFVAILVGALLLLVNSIVPA